MAKLTHLSTRSWIKKILLAAVRYSLRNRPALGVGAALTLALVRLGPRWAERIRVLTYQGLVIAACEEMTVDVRRQGLQLRLNLSDNVQRCLFFCGTYEDQYLRYLKDSARPGDVYIDVGGHIGLDAFIVARSLIGCGRVICFEPSPDSAALIRSGSNDNGLAELIEVVECGLANEEGHLELRADPRMPAGDSGVRSRYNDGPVVANARLRRFDDWVDESSLDRIDIVKIDIEGGEYEALLGMKKSLIKFRPRTVVVEISDYRLRQAGTDANLIDKVLSDCGYEHSGQTFLENVVYRPKPLAAARNL